MNLDTTYLNLTLRSPLVVAASPLSYHLDDIKRMEDAGAGAVVLYSLFEEQIRTEQHLLQFYELHPAATPTDALKLFPAQKLFHVRLAEYLDHIAASKKAVAVPIIASLNCKSIGNWTDFAQQVEQAGADALELNIYQTPRNSDQTAEQIEDTYLTILSVIKDSVTIPVGVKLTPYFTNLSRLARRLDQAGAQALVLFNRFFLPDLDPKTLAWTPDVLLGQPADSRLPLHWIRTLYGSVKADLAATGGIFTAGDVVKMLMVGARVTMLASLLLTEGIDRLRTLEQELRAWLDENDYESVASLQGILYEHYTQNGAPSERADYIRTINPFQQET